MKKILAIILSICFVLCLTACNKDKAASDVTKDNSQTTSTQTQTNTSDESSDRSESNTLNNSNASNDLSNSNGADGSSNNTSIDANNSNGTNSSSNSNNTNSSNNSNGTNSTNNSNPPPHTHSYSDATCTAPAKCSCGATDGSALGHKWQNATCNTPKTCSVCKATEGNKLKHRYDEDGNCSLCKFKDPDFKYPAVSSMNGVWKSVHKQNNRLSELTYHFTLNPSDELLPFGVGEWVYLPEEEIQLENNESLDDFQSIVWTDGKTYYKFGGGMFMEGSFEESNDIITVTDYYSNNKKLVLQRISTNSMKVISFDAQIEYQIPIGTILTFHSN